MRATVLCIMRAASQQPKQNSVYAARQNRVLQQMYCRGDGTGRRAGLKIRCQKWRGGSIPPPGTKFFCIVSAELSSITLLAYDTR